ncbi:RmlC-like cupin domain-containing protein [Protomyces lactucae-debilis]|uniref:RmlC-like cupin domain-containing protein n=1 Tax=Protomyces lactucae-debilis TaxID=2754530 RepID=A0A1Y2F3S3_PROLT|nr:RmlC-like cupin domain-containing protein [Protomyces lactucae-debilis]ORY78558.1 RmlC-like cupin domain-containing protein [Protomyces lactucae-debilis]
MTTSAAAAVSPLKLTLRKSLDRGIADHGWLKSAHTFSFANYYDPAHSQHGPLRVINEDFIEKGTGFGKHPHREFEIFTYVIDGVIQHDDSMGNSELVKRGEIQMTSAGTGIQHAEYNGSQDQEGHICQIWVKPNKAGLTPRYATGDFSDDTKRNVLKRVVASADAMQGGESDAVPIHANLSMYASLLEPGKTVSHVQKRTFGYIHHIMSSGFKTPKTGTSQLKVNGQVLNEGDGLYIDRKAGEGEALLEIESTGEQRAEFLLFDMDN